MHSRYQILRFTSGNFRHPFASLKLNALTRSLTNKANTHINPNTILPQYIQNKNYKTSMDKTFQAERRIHTEYGHSKCNNLLLIEQNQTYESLSKRNTKAQFYKQNNTRRYLRTVKTDERILTNVMKIHQQHVRSPLNLQIHSLQRKDNSDQHKKFTLNNTEICSPQSNNRYQKIKSRSIQKKIRSFNIAKPGFNFFNDQKRRITQDLNLIKSRPGNVRINKLILQRKNVQQWVEQKTDLCPWEPQLQIDMHQIHTEKTNLNPQKPSIKIKKRKKRK